MTTSHENELVLISGASTGMGAATAAELARRGYHVLAGVRTTADADAIRSDRIEPLVLDITDEGQVRAAAQRVADDPERRPLRALVNNAGLAANGPVETLPMEVWRRMFEVNLFGHIGMTQALLPALHASAGRIVTISSTGGKIAMPGFGAYSATKYAIEAVSDALRRELAPHGVGVVIVEPGAVRTAMGASGLRTARELLGDMPPQARARYDRQMGAVLTQLEEFGRNGMPAERAAVAIADAVTSRHPRPRVTVGRDAALFTRLSRILSDRMLDRALAADERRRLRTA